MVRNLRSGKEQVQLFVDYETKTDQGAIDIWYSFPRRVDNPVLDPLSLFSKYGAEIEKKYKKNCLTVACGRALYKTRKVRTRCRLPGKCGAGSG